MGRRGSVDKDRPSTLPAAAELAVRAVLISASFVGTFAARLTRVVGLDASVGGRLRLVRGGMISKRLSGFCRVFLVHGRYRESRDEKFHRKWCRYGTD